MDSTFKRKFLKGVTASSIGQIIGMLFNFLSITILTRTMEVKEFGLYSLILVITYLFNTLGSFGLEITLVQFITRDEEKTDKVLFPLLVIKFLTTIFFCLIFYFFSQMILQLFDKNLVNLAFPITVLIFLGSFRDVLYNLLQGLNLFRKYAITQTVAAFVRVLSIVLIIYFSVFSFNNLILVEILTTIFAIVLIPLSAPMKSLIDFHFKPEIYRKIIKFTLPVYLNNIFTIVYNSSNTFVIGILLTPVYVAYYDVSSKVPTALRKITASFMLVYFPSISSLLSRGDKESALRLINKSLAVISVSLGVLVFSSLILGKEIITILFSEKYLNIYTAFVLMMFNFQLRTLANIMGYSILSSGHPEIPMKVNIFTSMISLGGALLFIPMVGFIGAVYALIIMNVFSLLQYYYYLKKLELRIKLFNFLQPMIVLIVSGLTFYFILNGITPLILKIVSLALYVVLNYIFVGEVKSIFKNVKKYIPILNKSI